MFIKEIESELILRPLSDVIGIVERKQPLPILSNVLIQKNQGTLRVSATDLEIQISTQKQIFLEDSSHEEITVSAKKLQEILRVIPGKSKTSFDISDGKLVIKANKSRFVLQTLPAQDFPLIPIQLDNPSIFTIKSGAFKSLLALVQYAMAQQDIRYYLNGILLVTSGMEIKAIATDGHRLAYASATFDQEFGNNEVILSRKTVNELFKLLDSSDESVSIELSPKQVRFSFSDITLTTKVIDGKFPDYQRVIPNYSNHLLLDRVTVLQALQRAAILSNEKFRGIRFVLTEKNLRIISSNSEQEEAQEDIETDYHGPALDIGFNVNYLLDGLNNTPSDKITFSFGDPNSSILITIPDRDDFKYVVMPMRI